MFSRTAPAVSVAAMGLAIVYWNGPLQRQPRHAPQAAPEVVGTASEPRQRGRPRTALANGVPVSYETSVSKESASDILRHFRAEGITQEQVGRRTLTLPALQGLSYVPGVQTAMRWVRLSPGALPSPEVLLVFGERPAVTYRLTLGVPPANAASFNALREFESRLGIVRSGLGISYGLIEGDGSWVFLGQDSRRRALSAELSALLAGAGWRKGISSTRSDRGMACFSRWDREVCILRDASGAISASMGTGSPVFNSGWLDGRFASQTLFKKGTE